MFVNPVMGPPRPRQASGNAKCPTSASGSPLTGHIKKPLGPCVRPRKLFKRSLSMFNHPTDVMKQENKEFDNSGVQPVMDIDDAPRLSLPHFKPSEEPDSLPRITQETLLAVLNGDYDHLYDDKTVVDCRFEYEYTGGHIDGAVNHTDKEGLAQALFDPISSPNNKLLIFHCEFSVHRAPRM